MDRHTDRQIDRHIVNYSALATKPLPTGGFSVNLQPPVVINLFSLLNDLYRERGGGGEGL